MSEELKNIKGKLYEAMQMIDVLIIGGVVNKKEREGPAVAEMIGYCLEVEKDTTFNADFASKMEDVMKTYNKLSEGQHNALHKHYLLAQRWK